MSEGAGTASTAGAPMMAVALRYDGQGAPRVTAKGSAEVAEAIVALAREHGVPMNQNADMAQVLSQVPLGEEIPESLYLAVAQVLVFVYGLTGRMPGQD